MNQTRITLPRTLFVHHKEDDFTDDGTSFTCFYYKDVLPVTKATYEDDVYLCIRPDYLGLRYETYREDHRILDDFNGVDKRWAKEHMSDFVANCEAMMNKYCNKEN